MDQLLDITSSPVVSLLDLLLKDKTTKKNIIWATDTYEGLGYGFSDKDHITKDLLLLHADAIEPRIQKALEAQQERTRKKAEVFTPAWLCNLMNNHCDEEWFGRKNVFNVESDHRTWTVTEEPIKFPKGKKWQDYVDSRRLEITCGEGPYLVSRYDTSTGERIVPPKNRIGQLDRKLRIVNENTESYDEWVQWTIRAFEATYGYEYQGDNLLIARINLLLTFVDYYSERWNEEPEEKLLATIANKIAWNLWQMDGLKDTVPFGKLYKGYEEMNFLEMHLQPKEEAQGARVAVSCKIYDWRRDNSILFQRVKENFVMGKKLFDFVIGNPPYQEDSRGANESDTPVYHYFLDETYKVANKVEVIHPARFLFNAGATPKLWNEKMLKDVHLKVLMYEPNASKIFSGTDIKGGVAITYRDSNQSFGEIGTFTAFSELNSIVKKVQNIDNSSLSDVITNRGLYRYSDLAYEEQPEEMKKTSDRRIAPSAFERMPKLFTTDKPKDENEYVRIYGNIKNERVYRWFRKDYLSEVENLYNYKVLVPKANGSGAIGEVLSTPLIGTPLIGFTETYISIGSTKNSDEAEAILKYIKTKFARALLGVLKVTQNNAKPVWRLIPLQDFTSSSDIDWSKSIPEIDQQLYRKYGLNEQEIEFIETHVKEMA